LVTTPTVIATANIPIRLVQTRRSRIVDDGRYHERDFDEKSEIRQHHAKREYAPRRLNHTCGGWSSSMSAGRREAMRRC
jgi:hypothetical protein